MTSSTDIAQSLHSVATQALFAYARAVDEGNLEVLRSAAAENIRISTNAGTVEGINSFLDVYRAYFAGPQEVSRHMVTNVEVENRTDHVRVRACFQAWNFFGHETRCLFGRYDDSMVVSDDALRLTHKRISVERILTLPIAERAVRTPK